MGTRKLSDTSKARGSVKQPVDMEAGGQRRPTRWMAGALPRFCS